MADLRARTRKIFLVVECAYTIIPTYPAGLIGFIVASKLPGRDLSRPLRAVPNTRYYNSALHTAAFTLPHQQIYAGDGTYEYRNGTFTGTWRLQLSTGYDVKHITMLNVFIYFIFSVEEFGKLTMMSSYSTTINPQTSRSTDSSAYAGSTPALSDCVVHPVGCRQSLTPSRRRAGPYEKPTRARFTSAIEECLLTSPALDNRRVCKHSRRIPVEPTRGHRGHCRLDALRAFETGRCSLNTPVPLEPPGGSRAHAHFTDAEFARVILDTGKNILDTGKNILDTGKNILDTGKNILDTGKNILDTGKNILDTGKNILDTGKNILPVLRLQAPANATPRKVLLLGSGYVARPAAEYIARSPLNRLTIACRTLVAAESLAEYLPRTATAALEAAVAEADLVVSPIPYTYYADQGQDGRPPRCSRSMMLARPAGITVLNEIGLDPGIDHLYAVKTIGELQDKGGMVKFFLSYCGGLPSPDCTPNPLLYKFSWSSRGVLLALLNPARFLSHAQPKSIPGGRRHTAHAERGAHQGRRVRLQGGWLKEGMTWAEVGAKIVGAKEASESAILAAIASLLPGDKNTRDQVVSGLRWIGLLGAEKATVRLMRYEQGEQDMIVFQHRFDVQWKDGGNTSTLITYGNPLPGGYTAMALTVGLPCGIATQLVLDGEIKTKGVCTPYFGRRADGSKYAGSSKEAKDMCALLRVNLEEEGVGCVEGKL
ncbi:Saccharopine dehydrogenase-domain-containing protein [Hysterangium stoloniferum]|nr:Saccharopine dehydrogenase-domain-containing protein [Hysterangium stoloniferum]